MFGASALAVRARYGGLSYPAAGHRWAEGHASSPEGAVFLALLAITAVVGPVIWLV